MASEQPPEGGGRERQVQSLDDRSEAKQEGLDRADAAGVMRLLGRLAPSTSLAGPIKAGSRFEGGLSRTCWMRP